MTDVRLTALNPEDSKVYPVACNASGELLVDKGEPVGPDLDIEGDLTVGGSAEFKGNIKLGDISTASSTTTGVYAFKSGQILVQRSGSSSNLVFGAYQGTDKTIDIQSAGSASFAGDHFELESYGLLRLYRDTDTQFPVFTWGDSYADRSKGQLFPDGSITAAGSGTFAGDVIIGSRGAKWLIRESNGVAMLIEQTRRGAKEPRIEEVRDLPRELDLVEAALSEIMGKLKMTPPAGWPVWDGSDNPDEK